MKKKNPVKRFAREGEHGWKPGEQEHKPKKKYSRHDRRSNKDVNRFTSGDGAE